jgi:hypothetical protein
LETELPVAQATLLAFSDDFHPTLKPVFVSHRQHVCHVYPTFSCFLEKLTGSFSSLLEIFSYLGAFG